MNLFSFNKDSYDVTFAEEIIMLIPFRNVIQRDKTKDKDIALKELAFVYFYADIRSPYQSILLESDRLLEIKRDIDLPIKWKKDSVVDEAIRFYIEKSKTAVHHLYESSMTAASAIYEVLSDAKNLIAESEDKITATTKVISTLEKVPKVMASLGAMEKELLRQIEDKEGKKIGSKSFALYEEGLKID